MTLDQEVTCYRAMSVGEYRCHESGGSMSAGCGWAEPDLERRWGFKMSSLKKWVDEGSTTKGDYDVVVRVRSCYFSIPVNKKPPRYENDTQLAFEQVEVFYDPRATVSERPVLWDENEVPLNGGEPK